MHTNCPCTPTYIWHTHMTCAATFNTLLRFFVPNATAAAQMPARAQPSTQSRPAPSTTTAAAAQGLSYCSADLQGGARFLLCAR
jgi:hypothetical protein